MRTFLILGILLICGVVASAQEPLGDPNEAWITCSTGDTIYVGQPVELEVHLANEYYFYNFFMSFKFYSDDGAKWVWLPQDGPTFEFIANPLILSAQPNSRFWGDALETGYGTWSWEPSGESVDAFWCVGWSWSAPHVPAGPLEHAYSIHFMPTETGTICIHSAIYGLADANFIYNGGGTPSDISWNGPFCFEVVESTALGDVNCDGQGNVGDIVYMINWVFKSGPPPCK